MEKVKIKINIENRDEENEKEEGTMRRLYLEVEQVV